MKPHQKKLIAALVSLACSVSAHAVLERVGPPDAAPAVGGFPAWYQDTTGLALEFCDPKNAAEVAGGWCLLLAADVPVVPENFPNQFSDEHFHFAASAVAKGPNLSASLVLAVEDAFAAGVASPGDQITFSRIRVKIGSVPVSGTYRFIHPYGEEVIEGVAGERIFFTDDVGLGCPAGSFDCATQSRLGPFLLPAATPGGAELPAVPGPVPGKLYLADPARNGPVTGSALPDFVDSTGALRNHNIFRVEGPVGSNIGGPGIDYVESTDFALMGRLYTNTMVGRVAAERASYTRDLSGQRLDVFASAFPTTQGRLPTQPRPVAIAPLLSFFSAACGGTVDAAGTIHPPFTAPLGAVETQMLSDGEHHWGQSQPAVLPAAVCVKDGTARDINGNIVPVFVPRVVTDDVTITQAAYDPNAGSLTVAAQSSDATVPPTLTVSYGTVRSDLSNGQLVSPVVVVPPGSVRVHSAALGADRAEVRIGALAGAAPAPVGIPVAVNDAVSFPEDSPTQILPVLANDNNALGGTVSLVALPRLGTAVVNPDGTVSYTPRLNANGADAFTYTVTVGTTVSNSANVALDISPVNDPPSVLADSVAALANHTRTFNLLGNDSDPDGASDLVAAVNVTQPTPLGAAVTVNGGVADFTASAAGTYTFTYQAQDAALAVSANVGTVTVQVAATETVSVGTARYIKRRSRLDISGTIAPAAEQTVTLDYVNSAGNVLGAAGTARSGPTGLWAVDVVGAPLPPAGTTAIRATSSYGTVVTAPFKLN